jgi:hypothetical protein
LPDLTLPVLAALAGSAWLAALCLLGVTTHPAVLSWRRLARLRGLADQRPAGERLGSRLRLVRRLQRETDIARLLLVAGRREAASAWLLRTAVLAGLTLLAVLLLDEVALLATGRLAGPPGLALVAAALVTALAYVRLRNSAVRRRQALGRAVADSLPHLAVMTYHHRLPVAEALLVFARCQRDESLHRLLSEAGWRWLGEVDSDPPPGPDPMLGQSTALLYERLGRALGVPMFVALGSAVRRISERGLSSQEAFTRLARATYGQRLAEARVAAAQAKTLIVVPIGLMIAPVLLLIGAPLAASLLGSFGR